MNDSSVEKAVKWYLYDLRNNKDNSISKEKEKQTKSLAKRYSKDRKTKATESELLILSEINKIGLSDIKNPRDAKTTLTDRGLILLNVRELDNTVGSSDGTPTEDLDSTLHSMEETSTKDLGGNPNMTFIDEGNLYQVIFQSRKPNAVKFKEWICYNVIPSIRKHGAYIDEDVIKDNKKLNESIQAIRKQYKEKIDFADDLTNS